MKKLITSLITAMLPLFALFGSVQAQESNALAKNSRPNSPASHTTIGSAASKLAANSPNVTKDTRKEAREQKQFNRITRFFKTDFSDASDVTWTKEKDGYTVAFTRAGLKNVIWYNPSGVIFYSLVSYPSDRLADDIKGMVKMANKGYEITWVNEIHQDNNVVYLVSMENDRNIKQVTVYNGEMNVYKKYTKAL